MSHIICRVVESRKEIDDALRIRHAVFVEELQNLDPARNAVPREVDPYDLLETTVHFVAYLDGVPVGAARMLMPNQEVARATGTAFGFDIESKFDLTQIAQTNLRFAETMRYCVLAHARNKPVAAIMHSEGVRFSRKLGITHWLGRATIETKSPEEAARIESIGASLGFVHDGLRITPRQTFCPTNANGVAFAESATCQWTQIAGSQTNYPRILAMYSRRLGARIIGPPLYDPRFRGYSIPVVMAIADQRIRDSRDAHVHRDHSSLAA